MQIANLFKTLSRKLSGSARPSDKQTWSENSVKEFADAFEALYPSGFPIKDNEPMSFQVLDALRNVPSGHLDDVYAELEQRGIGLLNAASMDSGEPVILPFEMIGGLSGPIVLSKEGFEARRTELGKDEFCFETNTETWKNLAGRAGIASVQDGRITSLVVTVLN